MSDLIHERHAQKRIVTLLAHRDYTKESHKQHNILYNPQIQITESRPQQHRTHMSLKQWMKPSTTHRHSETLIARNNNYRETPGLSPYIDVKC